MYISYIGFIFIKRLFCRVYALPRLQRLVSERWGTFVKTAWSVDPRIALALVARFPGSVALKMEVSGLVQVCSYRQIRLGKT